MVPSAVSSRFVTALTLLLASSLFVTWQEVSAMAEEPETKVERLVSAMDRRELQDIWALAYELENLGSEVIPSIRRSLETAKANGKLGCAKVLLSFGETAPAVEALKELIRTAGETSTKLAALGLLESTRNAPSLGPFLLDILDETYEPKERIAVAKTLWTVTTSGKVRRNVRDELLGALKSENEDIRFEAALALAEVGHFSSAKRVLKVLRDEPTLRGQLARNYLDLDSLGRKMERVGSIQSTGKETQDEDPVHVFIDDLLNLVDSKHYSANDVDREILLEGAARGMLRTLDPYSTYFSAEAWEKWNFDLNPNYGGIGAYVNFIEGTFTIMRPIYSGPAYKLGLRSNDQILKVGDWSTRGQELEEITRRLKGPAGTGVNVTVYRKGWAKPRPMDIVRDAINIPTAKGELLAGGVGYTRLDTFGGTTAEELTDVINELKSQGMTGLVLDLRDNFGGYLRTAEKVADLFLPDNALVVQWKDREGLAAEYRAHLPGTLSDLPMTVLVNSNSASASEIVAGALKDHKRATLIGTTTYGKGSVQNVLPVDSRPKEDFFDSFRRNGRWDEREPFTDENGNGQWDPGEDFEDEPVRNGKWDGAEDFVDANANGVYDEGESFTDADLDGKYTVQEVFTDRNNNGRYDLGPMVKLTIARWFLPVSGNIDRKYDAEGKRIERGGVLPDHKVKLDRVSPWKIEELQKMQEAKAFDTYLDEHFEKHLELFKELAVFDGFEPGRYPGFEEFYKSLDTPVPAMDVRRWLKRAVQRRVADIRGREFIEDYQNDAQLQKAILVLLEKMGMDPSTVDSYSFIPERVAEREKKAKDEEDWEDSFE